MPIASYFPYEPTTGQWMAVNMLDVFFESDQQVFVLQGYAGTGKTTLLKVVLDYLEDKDTTCHKAQGGEWNEIFLYLDNKIHGIPKPGIYQWMYTAVTRAKNTLHVVNDWFIK